MKPLNKILVVGVGLIGASFALALRKQQKAAKIVGLGRSEKSLQEALALGVIDEIDNNWASALAGTDFVLLAMPVGQCAEVLRQMQPHLQPGTVVSDVGSTKQEVIRAMTSELAAHLPFVVPAHPIAGAEKSGAVAARVDLYQNRKVIITPLDETSDVAVELVTQLWQACGAEVVKMSPSEHDRVFAAVSHLPHLLSFGLVHEFASRANAEALFGFAAGGFRDFTRIAGSNPEMWRDICISNRQPLVAELDDYLSELALLRAYLLVSDGDSLHAVFEKARDARAKWLLGDN